MVKSVPHPCFGRSRFSPSSRRPRWLAAIGRKHLLRADRLYRVVLSFDGFLREFEYEIDADRLLRIISRDRERPEVLEAEVLPIEKQSNVVAIRGEIDAAHPSLIA